MLLLHQRQSLILISVIGVHSSGLMAQPETAGHDRPA